MWQTRHVIDLLQLHWPSLHCELVPVVTQGDKRLDRPLPEIGGKGLFTAELEDALRRGEIDLAVHSLKHLPVEEAAGLTIGAILSREDVRDVVVAHPGWTLATLPQGAIVGTSSLRRQAQLLALRPDLHVRSIRGNVDTRIRKVMEGEYHAAVMAAAGLTRLGLTEHIVEWLEPEAMLSAPGQGALAVQCRSGDTSTLTILAAIHDVNAERATTAERQLLYHLGGGCSAPVGAWAQVVGEQIDLRARVISIDGRQSFDVRLVGSDARQLARDAADSLTARGARLALGAEGSLPMLPLKNKRVVITRPLEQSMEFAQELERQGALPLTIPAIRLASASDAPSFQSRANQLVRYDWLIFTSANAVEYFWLYAGNPTSELERAGTRIAAVGPATQSALQKHGVTVHAIPEHFEGIGVATALGNIEGKRILLPRSTKAGHELPAALAALGAQVDLLPLYSPQHATIGEEERVTLTAGVDVVTFASGSAVRSFVATLRQDPRFTDFWSKVIVACIGPSTADVARAEGLPVHVVATEHTVPGLVAALIAYYQKGS